MCVKRLCSSSLTVEEMVRVATSLLYFDCGQSMASFLLLPVDNLIHFHSDDRGCLPEGIFGLKSGKRRQREMVICAPRRQPVCAPVEPKVDPILSLAQQHGLH